MFWGRNFRFFKCFLGTNFRIVFLVETDLWTSGRICARLNRYQTQKAHWLGWLDSKSNSGTYQRKDAPNRGAKFVYNHIMEPKMLLWLISASGVDVKLVTQAEENAANAKTMASSCAAIRKVVSWEALELVISNK